MLKLSKNHQLKIKIAAEDVLLGSDVEETPGSRTVTPKTCEYEGCGLPMKLHYPGGDPENGPACWQCDEGHSLCEGCKKPIDGAGACIECMEKNDDPGVSMDEPDDYDEAEELLSDDANDISTKMKYDARREAATPHAHAAKDLFSKRRQLMQQVNMLDDQLANHREVLRALDPKMKHKAYADDKELRVYLRPEKVMEKKRKRKLDKQSEKNVIENLLKVAEVLDYAGDLEGVTLVENVLQIFAKKDDDIQKYDLDTVEKTERKYPDVAAVPPSMSTRHCPDHHGIQMKRVAEGTFQCELDGRMYNWNQGFKDYSGNTFPAAPIRSVDFPDTMERMFETRQMATNKKTK